MWNQKIQAMNINPEHILTSKDVFAEVDDDHGILRAILTTDLKRDYSHTDVPNHELTLKVNDICMITRNLHAMKLPSNSRVRILKINQFSIAIETMEGPIRRLSLPRIKFKFKLK
jgi:hypothetical protein